MRDWGNGAGASPDFGVDRFYVDERSEFTKRGIRNTDDAYLVATVDRDGHLHPFDLIVAGQSVRQHRP
jgi:hypothetical protein